MSDQENWTALDCTECGQPLDFTVADADQVDVDLIDVVIAAKGHCVNAACSKSETSDWLNQPGTGGGANGADNGGA